MFTAIFIITIFLLFKIKADSLLSSIGGPHTTFLAMRILHTSISEWWKIVFTLPAVKDVGQRCTCVVLNKVAWPRQEGRIAHWAWGGMCDHHDAEPVVVQDPKEKDGKDGKYSQVLASGLDDKLRRDLEGLKKIWAHRGLCHFGDLRPLWPHCGCVQEEINLWALSVNKLFIH